MNQIDFTNPHKEIIDGVQLGYEEVINNLGLLIARTPRSFLRRFSICVIIILRL